MTELAPIVLFTYKRVDTLIKTIEALQRNHLALGSDLYIFSDAAKGIHDQEMVSEVRKYIHSISGFKTIKIYESNINKGLASSIINGVSEVMKKYEKVIVLEDDLVTSSNFLDFMNTSLVSYESNQKVFSISGYGLHVRLPENYEYDVYFTPRGMSWGWATWRNRWEGVDWELKDFKNFVSSKTERRRFAIGGSDLNDMLQRQVDGKIDSWAIRWYFDQFKKKQLTLYPIKSKVKNLGFDEMATHTNAYNRYKILFDDSNKREYLFETDVKINPVIFKSFKSYFGFFSRIFYGRIVSPIFRKKQFFLTYFNKKNLK
ncbi:glycosyltransferase family protein [Flavobacterium saccharophilum]|uniref:Glycosyl transferase family 2 n=1 Tax=Flavobacterium saccharophilum TaxID=29534 RepID=A0A1M7GSQ1_9FLAO|nr:hypothetical protein [Flavobacterium saccharophilum]SHM19394.1 hypothetical protein SAMN05444366_2676 [Flavobacterium saccharophilum]